MVRKKTDIELFSFKCPIRSINNVHYIKIPPEFHGSYKSILKEDGSYIKIIPIGIGNNICSRTLAIPKTTLIKKVNEVVGWVGEIAK